MHNYKDIADYFIWKANDTGSLMTNLKLQKLLYYAQAWYVTLYDKPLIKESFEAWVHGPAIPECYREYKRFKWKPIDKDIENKPDLPPEVCKHVDEVADVYMIKDAYELELLSHSEDPWRKARGDLAPYEASHNVVKLKDMKKYYSTLLSKEEQ